MGQLERELGKESDLCLCGHGRHYHELVKWDTEEFYGECHGNEWYGLGSIAATPCGCQRFVKETGHGPA